MHYDLLDIDSLLLSDKEAIRYLLISPQHYYDLGHIVDLIQHDFMGICAMYPYLFMSMHQYSKSLAVHTEYSFKMPTDPDAKFVTCNT